MSLPFLVPQADNKPQVNWEQSREAWNAICQTLLAIVTKLSPCNEGGYYFTFDYCDTTTGTPVFRYSVKVEVNGHELTEADLSSECGNLVANINRLFVKGDFGERLQFIVGTRTHERLVRVTASTNPENEPVPE